MEVIFLKILNMSISASWLIMAILLIRGFMKKVPKWAAVWLWGIVAVRLLLPVTIETNFSLIPSAQTISTSIQYEKEPSIQTGISQLDEYLNPMIGDVFAANVTASVNPVQIWLFTGSFIWIAGVLLLLLYGGITLLRIYRKVRESAPVYHNIRICDHIATPFILGFLHPVIYLPSGMDEKTQDYVLAHEQAHLKRGDHFWKPIGFFLLAVHWFNPLVWIAYMIVCRDIEMACDEKVIYNMDLSGKKDYANALVSCSLQKRWILACPLAFGEVGVKERVKGVLYYRKPAFWMIILTVIICGIFVICFLTNPVKDSDIPINVDIDYGISELYTKADMDTAIEQILDVVNTSEGWEGCELHSIRYGGDECQLEVGWLNAHGEVVEKELKFTQAIRFISEFHSPIDPEQAGAFNPDVEYTGWSWWLGREENGEWHLVDWGY